MKISLAIVSFSAVLTLSLVSARIGEPRKGHEKEIRGPVPLPIPKELMEKIKAAKSRQDDDDPDHRIVGGTEVSAPGVYPFYVSWSDECGGSLIHPDIVLTAAHCAGLGDTVTVNAYELGNPNTDGAESRTISEYAVHPEYGHMSPTDNDFMLLKLSSPVTSFSPIAYNHDSSVPATGQELKVIGLGTTSHGGDQADKLREVTVETMSDQECNDAYFGDLVEDSMFCAAVEGGGKDSCQGDSGGPIFTLTKSGAVDKQVGVVSWGFGCADAEYPGVYAEISLVAEEWLQRTICEMSDDKPGNCPSGPPTEDPGPDEVAVTLTVRTDRYPSEIGWDLKDESGVAVEDVFPGDLTIALHTYVKVVNLKKGKTYTFEIYDTFEDGLCCGGYYEVEAEGQVLAHGGGNYEASDTATFVVPGGGEHEDSGDVLKIKQAIATSSYRDFTPDRAIDGKINSNSRWSSVWRDNEHPDWDWLKIELEQEEDVGAVAIAWQEAYGEDYDIKVSDDGFGNCGSWKTAIEVRGGTGGIDVLPLDVRTKWLCVQGWKRATRWGYSIFEIKAYGKSSSSVSESTKIKQALATSSLDDYTPDQAINGEISRNSRWSSVWRNNEHPDWDWLKIELENEEDIGAVAIAWQEAYGEDYDIKVSNDGFGNCGSWETALEVRGGNGGLDVVFLDSRTKWLCMQGWKRATRWGYSIFEIEAYRK